jgi:hypothetical protein
LLQALLHHLSGHLLLAEGELLFAHQHDEREDQRARQ